MYFAAKYSLQWNLYKEDTIGAKKVSALQSCPLYTDFFEDSLTAKQINPFLVTLPVLKRCPLYRVSALIVMKHWVMKFYRHILSKYRQISKKSRGGGCVLHSSTLPLPPRNCRNSLLRVWFKGFEKQSGDYYLTQQTL